MTPPGAAATYVEAVNNRYVRLANQGNGGFMNHPKVIVRTLISAMLLAGGMCIAFPAAPQPQRIKVEAKRFEFAPAVITVKKGEPVVLVLKSDDVAHGIRFRDLGVEMNVSKGGTAEVHFTPQKTGDFLGQCSVFCGAGHGHMSLTMHVVD